MLKLQSTIDTDYFLSFDISSLFTNVPFYEINDICADFLYRSLVKPLSFPEIHFVKLIEMATKSVSFSFNNPMYTQIDGVAMISSLGPTYG